MEQKKDVLILFPRSYERHCYTSPENEKKILYAILESLKSKTFNKVLDSKRAYLMAATTYEVSINRSSWTERKHAAVYSPKVVPIKKYFFSLPK